MLTALDFWHLVEQIIPVYVIVILAYALTKFNVIEPTHAPGISRWVSILGVPTYVFHLLAFNDPYQTSLRLVAADFVSKALALLFSCLWWRFSKSGSIDGVIGFFMLATLPNTVLIGDALLQPLYGDEVETEVVTIIFMQCLLWYNVCICLYEGRIILLEDKQLQAAAGTTNAPVLPPSGENEKNDDHIIHFAAHSNAPAGAHKTTPNSNGGPGENVFGIEIPGRDSSPSDAEKKNYFGRTDSSGSDDSSTGHVQKSLRTLASSRAGDGLGSQKATLERTISAPAGFFFWRSKSRSHSFKRTPQSKVRDFDLPVDVFSGLSPEMKHAVVPAITSADAEHEEIFISGEKYSGNRQTMTREASAHAQAVGNVFPGSEGGNSSKGSRSSGFARWGVLGLKMLNRVKKAPLTYASVAGFVYSLVAQKYEWDMPYPIQTSLELISQGAIGMAIFLMGLAWARSGRLISCGWKALVYGLIVRFLIGPILMIVSAKAVLMHGQSFRFAVLQAVIPQGVISFVLAKEYGLDVPLFNTAVVFQLVIFLPIVLCYYYILEQV